MKNGKIKSFTSLALTLLLLLTSIMLPSCHGRRAISDFTLPDGLDENKTYEISFWAKNENNETQRNVYADAVRAFEEIYPNIKVNLRNFTDYNDIYKDVITNISTRTTPNVCITYPDHVATYIEGDGVVVPLDSLISDEKYGLGGSLLRFDGVKADEIVPEFLAEGVIDGSLYTLPFMRSTEICYVNKTLLESLGYTLPETLTWDFVFEVSEYAMSLGQTTATGKDGKEETVYVANGQSTLIPFIYKSTDNMMITMLRQADIPYSDDSGEIFLFNDETSDILKEISVHAKSGAFSTFKISSYPGNFLNAGQCIFAIDSSAGATWMGSNAPHIDIHEGSVVDFEIEVMTVPQYDTENPQMISQGPSLCIFNKEDSEEVLASWLFAQFLLTNETQIAYAKTEGYIPVTLKAQESDEYLDYISRAGEDNDLYYDVKIEASRLFVENMQNTFTAPVFNGSTSLRNAAGEMIENVTKAGRRKKTVDDEYIADLYAEMKSLYKLDGIAAKATTDLGPLPTESKILLATLSAAWLALVGAAAGAKIGKRKQKRQNKITRQK